MRGRITKSSVEQLTAGERLWDHGHREVVKGFGVRRQGDAITYYVRFRFQGIQRMCALGSHGHLTPDEARILAKQKLGQVAGGVDPFAAEKKAGETARAKETFEKKIEQYLRRRREAMKPRAFRELERHFNNHANPLHGLRLNEIRKATVADVLDGIEENRGPVARNRFRSNLSAFFAWAIAEGFLETNPVEGTAKAEENGPRERVLTPLELAEVWMALGTDDFSTIVRLLILTGQRREEVGGLRWSEVDLEKGSIVLPPGRTKNKRQHELPLSPQASAILVRRKALMEGRAPGVGTLGRDTSLVFGEGQRGFSGWGYSKARLDKRIAKQREGGGAKPMPKWTLHDLRRTAATIMAENLGVLPHTIEAILNHTSGHKGVVAGAYNGARYTDEMRAALCNWALYVDEITLPSRPKAVSVRATPLIGTDAEGPRATFAERLARLVK
jgi:integrase